MARAGRELAIAQSPHLPAHRLLGDGYVERVKDPLHQVDQTPAHHAVDGRDRPVLHDLLQGPALGLIEPGRLTGCLAVDQPLWPVAIEAQDPVAHGLQSDIGDAGRIRARSALVDHGQGQQTSALMRIVGGLGEAAQRCGIEIGAKADRRGHGKLRGEVHPGQRITVRHACLPRT